MLPRAPRLSQWLLPGHLERAKRRPWQRLHQESLGGSDGGFYRSGYWSSELQSNCLVVAKTGEPVGRLRNALAARRDSCNQRQGGSVYSVGSTKAKDGTLRMKLEIPFGHAFDRREVSSSQGVLRNVVDPHTELTH